MQLSIHSLKKRTASFNFEACSYIVGREGKGREAFVKAVLLVVSADQKAGKKTEEQQC